MDFEAERLFILPHVGNRFFWNSTINLFSEDELHIIDRIRRLEISRLSLVANNLNRKSLDIAENIKEVSRTLIASGLKETQIINHPLVIEKINSYTYAMIDLFRLILRINHLNYYILDMIEAARGTL